MERNGSQGHRVVVAIESSDRSTICGFCGTATGAQEQFTDLVDRLQRQGVDGTVTVQVTGGRSLRFDSIRGAAVGLASWMQQQRPTVELPSQSAPAGAL